LTLRLLPPERTTAQLRALAASGATGLSRNAQAELRQRVADELSKAPVRPHKYGARKTVVDGITFDSAREAKRYGELKLLERAGQITHLELQPKFPLIVNGRKVAEYRADFSYLEIGGASVVEDVKGVRTPVYVLKAKLVEALYGFQVREV
jgi:hypothetical protein